MRTLARLLQLAALAILPMAMAAQLSERISTGNMLKFLLISVGCFVLGHTLQRYSGKSD